MKNTFKLIFRGLLKNRSSSVINILSLSISFALVIILSAYSISEFSTDKFHKNHKTTYLIQPTDSWIYTPAVLKSEITENLAGIEKTIRIRDAWNGAVYKFGNNDPIQSDLIFADKEFFDIFDYKPVEGDIENALKEPMSVVLSKSLAIELFGKSSAVGKTIQINNSNHLTVTAVFDTQKTNTTFSFNSICNLETKKRILPNKGDFTNWRYKNYQTFIQIGHHSQVDEITSSIQRLVPKEEREGYSKVKLTPLSKVYFLKISVPSFLKTGSKSKIFYLAIVAVLVLFIALANFISITTANWQKKTLQTSIMKVIGARRTTIISGMLLETMILFTIGFIIALTIIPFLTAFLDTSTAIRFNPEFIFSFKFLSLAFPGILLVSFLCTIFPSVTITSTNTIYKLKTRNILPQKGDLMAKGTMVTIQFVVAIALILFTILVQKQVDFGSNKLATSNDNIVAVHLTKSMHDKTDVLKELLTAEGNVKNVVFTQYYPGHMMSGWGNTLYSNGTETHVEFRTFSSDPGFFELMNLKLAKGRFYESKPSDKHKIVVNEQFVREYGLTDPLEGIISRGDVEHEIIGVVKDFHFKSVNEPIAPLVIRNDNWASVALVTFKSNNFKSLQNTVEKLKETASSLSPSFPVEVTFFDRDVHRLYESEILFRKAFTLFSLSAIFISCLGILAMSIFATQNRTKEIGIRKVNGAKIFEILRMLNKDFLKWVAIAFVLACPIAYYAMNKWLENFAYKTNLSWWIFALAGLVVFGIALITVSVQSYKAATRNPVEALRYE